MKRFYAAVGLYDHGCKLLRYIFSLISFLSVWENVYVCIRMNSKMEWLYGFDSKCWIQGELTILWCSAMKLELNDIVDVKQPKDFLIAAK